MDFLNNAIFSDETGALLGALLTRFDPEEYTERASVKLYTLDELLAQYSELEPRGFRLDTNGVLSADTSVRSVLSKNVMSFVEAECSKLGDRQCDVTDLVLYGVQHGGATLLNATAFMDGSEPPRIVPFINYRVSNSSLNIYGACRMEDGTFRTHSLLELEDGGEKYFHCVFPLDVDLSWTSHFCKDVGNVTIGETTMAVYSVRSHLSPFYTCVGESFLNYLAYNVAYYSVGRKFLKEVSPAVKDDPSQQDTGVSEQTRRYPTKNVSILHTYDKLCLSGISKCLGDNERLIAYLQEVPESTVTMHWLNKLFESPWYRNTEGSDAERARTACANLLVECKENSLKYGLELLTHRHYLTMLGPFDNVIPLVLKGGGVHGESVKRTTFK